jgi:hypothetical protein
MKAVKLVEKHARLTRALLAEFHRLVDALAERLAPSPGGRRKALRAGAVHRLREFCEHFAASCTGSLPALGRAVAEARAALSDWQPHELRNLDLARQEVFEGLARVSAELAEGMTP